MAKKSNPEKVTLPLMQYLQPMLNFLSVFGLEAERAGIAGCEDGEG
jgi:hypothetical protein